MLSKNRRFTLIELLVVVAIIGILASILMPSLSKARDKAHKALCINNMKQIGTGMIMYIDSYNEHFPTTSDNVTWDDRLSDFDGRDLSQEQKEQGSIDLGEFEGINHGIYQCTKDTADRWSEPHEKRSYSLVNGTENPSSNFSVGISNDEGWSQKISRITTPSDTIIMAESWNVDHSGAINLLGRGVWTEINGKFLNLTLETGQTFHNYKPNQALLFLFADSSVRNVTMEKTKLGTGNFQDGSMWDSWK